MFEGLNAVVHTVLFAATLVLVISGCKESREHDVTRFGQTAEIIPDRIERYKELQTDVWPEVKEAMKKAHIGNYSVYLKELDDGRYYLFRFYEYHGDHYEADYAEMLKNPKVREWNKETTACLIDTQSGENDARWVDMEEVFYFEGRQDVAGGKQGIERYGMVIGIRPDYIESYKLLHKHTWPEILYKLYEGNIRNYAIYLHELNGKHHLFSYFEYVGENFETDMAKVDNDPATIAWIKFTDEVCQLPLLTRKEGEWWAVMEEIVFHK